MKSGVKGSRPIEKYSREPLSRKTNYVIEMQIDATFTVRRDGEVLFADPASASEAYTFAAHLGEEYPDCTLDVDGPKDLQDEAQAGFAAGVSLRGRHYLTHMREMAAQEWEEAKDGASRYNQSREVERKGWTRNGVRRRMTRAFYWRDRAVTAAETFRIVLVSALESFDVPEQRLDVTSAQNRSWLLRNLAIRNAENPQLRRVLGLLGKLG